MNKTISIALDTVIAHMDISRSLIQCRNHEDSFTTVLGHIEKALAMARAIQADLNK